MESINACDEDAGNTLAKESKCIKSGGEIVRDTDKICRPENGNKNEKDDESKDKDEKKNYTGNRYDNKLCGNENNVKVVQEDRSEVTDPRFLLLLDKPLSSDCPISPLKEISTDNYNINALSFTAASTSQVSSPSFDLTLSDLSPCKIGVKNEGFPPMIMNSRLGSEDLSDIFSVEDYDLGQELEPVAEQET